MGSVFPIHNRIVVVGHLVVSHQTPVARIGNMVCCGRVLCPRMVVFVVGVAKRKMSNRRTLNARAWPEPARGHCRLCSKPVPRGRRTICGKPCEERIKFLCHATVQNATVWKRDKSVCALCGWDMKRFGRIMSLAFKFARSWPNGPVPQIGKYVQSILGSWSWEMDHIRPVCEGGGVSIETTIEQALANLRTLCPGCHKRETAALAKRRKDNRCNPPKSTTSKPKKRVNVRQ